MSSKARGRRVSYPDQREWEVAFEKRLLADEKARAAYRKLGQDGCLVGNLMNFLYDYTVGSITVFQEQPRRRDAALGGLKGVEGRLQRAASAMQRTLEIKWRSQPTFASFLRECSINCETGEVMKGKCVPDFALHLPSMLQTYSLWLEYLRKELQKNLSARRVGKQVYLAEFATYLELLTQQPPPWSEIVTLVNAARPNDWKEKYVDSSLLFNNFRNFTRRNDEFYRDTRAKITAYLAACAQAPEKERLTFRRWIRNHQTANKQPSRI
jgi:hypothetical protein